MMTCRRLNVDARVEFRSRVKKNGELKNRGSGTQVRMVTMGCRAMEPMKSLDRGEISAHAQAGTVRMRMSCLFPLVGPKLRGKASRPLGRK